MNMQKLTSIHKVDIGRKYPPVILVQSSPVYTGAFFSYPHVDTTLDNTNIDVVF